MQSHIQSIVVPKELVLRKNLDHIVDSDRCTGCGTCVLACQWISIGCLDYVNEKPVRASDCIDCGICLMACPRLDLPLPSIERTFLGKERSNEEFGVYKSMFAVRSKIDDVLKVCQDGGFVTSLLWWAFEKGVVDGAVVSGIGAEPWRAEPRLVWSKEELLKCAGTRYTYSPGALALGEAISSLADRVAFVGTPCQIQALRKAQMNGLARCVGSVSFTIGLVCSETFIYEGLLKEKVEKEMGIPLSEIVKINIKKRLIIYLKNGEIKEISLKEAKKYARKVCKYCSDLSSELADISAGSLGAEGWTIAIVRSSLGEQLFNNLVRDGVVEARSIEDFKSSFELLVKMSRSKRVKASKVEAAI